MSSRLIRVFLVVIAIAIVSAAGYLLKDTDATLSAQRAAADALRGQARALVATIADARAAQVAYVARGQGEDFWMGHVSKLLPVLNQQMADFGARLTAATAQAAFEPATIAVENFQQLDRRAQEFMKSGNGLLAADLIFSDGLEAMGTAALQVDAALDEQLSADEAAFAGERQQLMAVLGGAASGLLVLMIVLAFTGAAPKAVIQEAVAEPEIAPVAEFKPIVPNLTGAAQLCTDFGRVLESKQLPGLLQRTANVLDATGIIVWVAEASGQSLRPAMSFGYPDAVVARMGSIPRDAQNAAAAAFRAEEVRVASGDAFTSGALVAPLMTSDGCIGVLSAEMKGGSENEESSQALAAIFAAQLATLVSPPAAAAPAKTAAQG